MGIEWWSLGPILLALWTVFDGVRRRLRAIPLALWTIGMLVAWLIALPLYFATRPLRAGETRAGGRAWHALRGFALAWTVFMAGVVVAAIVDVARNLPDPGGGLFAMIGVAMSALGALTYLNVLLAAWFFVAMLAVLIGFFVLDAAKVERGPTGRLAALAPAIAPTAISPALAESTPAPAPAPAPTIISTPPPPTPAEPLTATLAARPMPTILDESPPTSDSAPRD
jgi:hypothetical protein